MAAFEGFMLWPYFFFRRSLCANLALRRELAFFFGLVRDPKIVIALLMICFSVIARNF